MSDYRRNGKRKRSREPRDRYLPVPRQLRENLLSIADSPLAVPAQQAQEIAKLLSDNFDDVQIKNEFFDLLVRLVLEQPLKIPFAAAVILYGNDSNPEITTEALQRAGERLQEAFNAGHWRDVKLLVRFLACLQRLFEGEGVIPLLDKLFDCAIDLQEANENDVVGLELVKIILLTLPYAMGYAENSIVPQALEILKKTEIVASMKLPIEDLLESYTGSTDEKPVHYLSLIRLLQGQMRNEEARGWAFAILPPFPKYISQQVDGQDAMVTAPALHPFPSLDIASPVNAGPNPLFPEAYFSLYADQEVETVPKTDDIAASLIRDTIVDTINILDFNRDAVATLLVNLDCYWHSETFIKRGMPFEKIRLGEIEGSKSTWKPEDMVLDGIFSQVFTLPNPERKIVYYHSVITETCKKAPGAVAPSLGRAIRFLFRNLDVMDLELVSRFLDWFAHHLSNFDYRWKWQEWVEDLVRSDLHPKKAFIIAAIDKEIRLSFGKRIKKTIEEEFRYLITEGKEKEVPDFKYADDRTPYAAEGALLQSQIRKKAPDAEIQETLNVIHAKASEAGVDDVLIPSTDAFVTCICYIGSVSFSHLISIVDRCKERLLAIGQESEAARRQIIASIVAYWKDQPGNAINIIDKLLNYTILTPISVIQWALADHLGAGEALSESWTYEMVAKTVAKVTNRVRQIVAARLQEGLTQEQIDSIDETLIKEREGMRSYFKFIDDAANVVALGINDAFIEKETNGELSAEDAAVIKAWGKRWQVVFRRKAQVEETVVGEQAVDARVRLLPVQMETDPKVESQNGNGAMDGVTVEELE
ncbi:nuclear cap-binding complex, subunit NCBP1/CBP80 [Lophium mytilinum]|uniref:Nuclear cap-binding complex, subunit NCBP1/CBP80 n=1 Tax=Lophium mytilinum TaxID=390894 RepID=A0A6A6QDN7_9PEZI|nr:nuclear cap-binding complex, subunit NCBP1/CBP80 [Lophium mytilinum]